MEDRNQGALWPNAVGADRELMKAITFSSMKPTANAVGMVISRMPVAATTKRTMSMLSVTASMPMPSAHGISPTCHSPITNTVSRTATASSGSAILPASDRRDQGLVKALT